MHPPPKTKELTKTYVGETAIGQIAVPFILDLGDFPRGLVVVDLDLAGDDLLFANTLDHIAGLEIHADGVASIRHFMTEPLDFLERRL